MIIHSLEWKDNKLYLLDQTRLPGTYVYLEYSDYLKVADAIKNLVVRGAPAIGIAAAYGMLLAYQNLSRDCQDIATIEKRFLYAADTMKMARPTAVNLFWAVDEMIKVFKNTKLENIYGALLRKANEIESTGNSYTDFTKYQYIPYRSCQESGASRLLPQKMQFKTKACSNGCRFP